MTAPALLCVHAHPDDEALFSAGASAHLAASGRRCALVTCTMGQLGIDAAGRPGNHPEHDDAGTRRARAGELADAAAMVGFSRAVQLGYEDSGLPGWAQNERPGAFVRADVEAAARVVAALIDELDARVVITYDENGFYGHPDHIQAHRVTRRAVELSARAERLFYPVLPTSTLARFVPLADARGVSLPEWVRRAVGVDEADVAVEVDARPLAGLKQRAIATHASQIDNADLVTMDEELFTMLFGIEYYRLGWSRGPVPAEGTDLFGGLS